jgi:hypothetical protein
VRSTWFRVVRTRLIVVWPHGRMILGSQLETFSVTISLENASTWVRHALCAQKEQNAGLLVVTSVKEWAYGWLFFCLPPGEENSTRSPYILDQRDGKVYCGSSII